MMFIRGAHAILSLPPSSSPPFSRVGSNALPSHNHVHRHLYRHEIIFGLFWLHRVVPAAMTMYCCFPRVAESIPSSRKRKMKMTPIQVTAWRCQCHYGGFLLSQPSQANIRRRLDLSVQFDNFRRHLQFYHHGDDLRDHLNPTLDLICIPMWHRPGHSSELAVVANNWNCWWWRWRRSRWRWLVDWTIFTLLVIVIVIAVVNVISY